MNNLSTLLVTGALMLFSIQIFAQTYDFEDAVIPITWQGDRSHFQVSNSNQLQLNAPGGSVTSSLSWPSIQAANCSWTFYVGYTFAASTTNYAMVYLFSTETNFASVSNICYYLKIGGATGSVDKIELIYQQGTSKQVVLESRGGIVGGGQVACRIQVLKNAAGKWELRTDSAGGYNYVTEASAQHWIANPFHYSGIRCLYSSTRRDKMYFDDISIQEPFAIQGYTFDNDSTVKIHFNRALSNRSLFDINLDFDAPFTIVNDNNYLTLCFPLRIPAGIYSATISNIFAINGDSLMKTSLVLIKEQTYYVGQLRISEWMSDPSPSYGLPEVEWIELVNMSTEPVNLDKISIADPSSKVLLPEYLLNPDSVVIICSKNACPHFSKQNCIEVNALPSLNNSMDSIFIWANDSLLLDFVWYDVSAMATDFRRNGGYSIVRKEYPEACFLTQKIDFAQDHNGGSPGVMAGLLASTAPAIEVTVISEREVNVKMDAIATGWDTSFYAPMGVEYVARGNYTYGTSYTFYLNQVLEPGSVYNFQIDFMHTCRNQMKNIGAGIEIIYPKKIEVGDVFVNEVLYNPNSGGVDFVEFYNATSKYIQLQHSHLYNEINGTKQQNYLSGDITIEPYGFLTLTSDTIILKREYSNTVSSNAFQLSNFLSLPDTGGKLVWVNQNGDTLDQTYYGDSYHNPLHRNTEGYSLEKISSYDPNFNSANWTTSAAYATPGYMNSQHALNSSAQPKSFYCNPCHVTTNLNGLNDFAVLHLGEETKGCFGSIGIYRLSGEKVIDLIVNQSLGSMNAFQWNGQQQGGGLLEDGIYVAVAEWWSANGQTHISKIAISTSQH